jgi:hypothetical protein
LHHLSPFSTWNIDEWQCWVNKHLLVWSKEVSCTSNLKSVHLEAPRVDTFGFQLIYKTRVFILDTLLVITAKFNNGLVSL